MGQELFRLGMELNYSYSKIYGEDYDDTLTKQEAMGTLWERLDGFYKSIQSCGGLSRDSFDDLEDAGQKRQFFYGRRTGMVK